VPNLALLRYSDRVSGIVPQHSLAFIPHYIRYLSCVSTSHIILSLPSSIKTLHRTNLTVTTMATLSTALALLASTALAGPSNERVWSSAS
jgi:hypothetical protein